MGSDYLTAEDRGRVGQSSGGAIPCLSQHCHLLLVFKIKIERSSVSVIMKIDMFSDSRYLASNVV